tara:strand:- start:3771 stop:4004 length:234 start_codon:yes stop_codon:yes gene_type:complete
MGRPTLTIQDFDKAVGPHGKLLYKIAIDNNLTIQQLADALTCTPSNIISIMKGIHNLGAPRLRELKNLYKINTLGSY